MIGVSYERRHRSGDYDVGLTQRGDFAPDDLVEGQEWAGIMDQDCVCDCLDFSNRVSNHTHRVWTAEIH